MGRIHGMPIRTAPSSGPYAPTTSGQQQEGLIRRQSSRSGAILCALGFFLGTIVAFATTALSGHADSNSPPMPETAVKLRRPPEPLPSASALAPPDTPGTLFLKAFEAVSAR